MIRITAERSWANDNQMPSFTDVSTITDVSDGQKYGSVNSWKVTKIQNWACTQLELSYVDMKNQH